MVLRLITGRPELPNEAAVAERLLRCDFSPPTAEHLAPLVLRHDRGESPELAGYVPRVLFVAWLRDHGYLSDEVEPPAAGTARNAFARGAA
jgi:hypothetical protein